MSDKPGAVLIADVGSLTTRVTLVDSVEGETRLIGHAEAPSTQEPPDNDILVGILAATRQISTITGRDLIDASGQLIRPQTSERNGVNHLLLTSSAAGNLDLVIVAIACDVSARSAQRAARTTYTSILQTVTLDGSTGSAEDFQQTSWVERQVERLLQLRPAAILLAGGLEGGARDVLCRLARIIAFTITHIQAISGSQQRTGHSSEKSFQSFPVIYAGNSQAQDCVGQALSNRAEIQFAANLRPTLEAEHLEATRQALTSLYAERILTRLPGLPGLQEICGTPVTTTCAATGLMVRFLAERYQRRVLALDVGTTSSSALFASPGRYHPAVLGTCGSGYGLPALLNVCGLQKIARWLPFELADDDLLHWVLNKTLRPQIVPSSREDLLIEHAIVREALALTFATLQDEYPAPPYDLVVAGGGVLAHAAHPGLAALTLLDALQPTAEDTGAGTLAIDMQLDTFGLLPACAALAALDSPAAVTLFDRDVMRNMPLATCVVALGEGRAGDLALEAELTTRRGKVQRVRVQHGQIARLPLSQGTHGKLTLRPAPGVRIGRNPPGAEVSSDVAAIGGSALGVVIDARGRPLQLAADAVRRRAHIWEWLVALGVERGRSPYLAEGTTISAAPQVETETRAPLAPERPATPAPAPASQTAAAPPKEPAVIPRPEPAAQPTPGARISLDDLLGEGGAAPTPPPEPAARPTAGARISLDDLLGEGGAAPTPPPDPMARTVPGARISLDDLLGEGGAAPTPPPEPAARPTPGARISLDDLAREGADSSNESAEPGLQDDLAKLRQSVEKPKKRGWFGREK